MKHNTSALLYEGKARRIAQIIDTRIHQRMEQALVEWTDGSTAWIGIQDLSSEAQDHVRARMHGELGVREEEDEQDENVRTQQTKTRRKTCFAKSQRYKQTRKRSKNERKKRQKKKEAEELDAKISMSRVMSVVNTAFSGAMLGDADDARRLMEFIIKRWGDEAKTDAAAAEHFPTVPSDETLAARVNEFLEFTSIAANTNVVCAVCGEFHLPDNTDVFHLGKRTDEKTTAKPLGALFNLLKLLKNPKVARASA